MGFGTCVGSVMFLLIREIYQPSSYLTAIHIGMYSEVVILTLTSWLVFLTFHGYWLEIVSGFNQLVTFEEYWTRESSTSPPTAKNNKGLTKKFRIRKLTSEELTGYFLTYAVLLAGIVAVPITAIFSVGTNIDPYFIIGEDYFLPPAAERSSAIIAFAFAVRFILVFFVGIEIVRSFFLVLLLTSSMGLVIKRLLAIILHIDNSHYNEAYQKFQLIWLQYYIIKSPFNNVLAIGSVIGFFGGTIIIWLSFNAWSHVTPVLASLFPFMALAILVILLVGISTQVSIVEQSNFFIYKWKQESLWQSGTRTRKDIQRCKLLGRTLRCLPVACGSCYGINSNTPFSFLQILMKAVTDSLLGIKM
ncbi:unnamed protein product [Orchesella dallaii]|uniref:Odorant receptor n=1 Tax=Orchesella dallaii TaxID=48710 RepID=A0ABP1R2I4_9HEXA